MKKVTRPAVMRRCCDNAMCDVLTSTIMAEKLKSLVT